MRETIVLYEAPYTGMFRTERKRFVHRDDIVVILDRGKSMMGLRYYCILCCAGVGVAFDPSAEGLFSEVRTCER